MMTTDAIENGPDETVTITKAEYEQLLKDQTTLKSINFNVIVDKETDVIKDIKVVRNGN